MIEMIEQGNKWLNNIVWGPYMLVLLVGVGVYFTVCTGVFQITRIGLWMKNTFGRIFKRQEAGKGAVTPFQALTTALAATVGTGNVTGVATAIASGGPGAVFWMWVSAFFGMMTKYAEVVLAVKYRERNAAGDWVGGPMYYIKNGLGKNWRFLAVLFAIFGAFAAFGIGNIAQIHSIATSLESAAASFGMISRVAEPGEFSLFKLVIGIIIAVFTGLVLIGGLKRIGKVTETFVPFMAVFYILGALIVVIANASHLGEAFGMIFKSAFNVRAAGGGVLGYTIAQASRYGIARGVFSNEAGLGSAPIAHAAADTDSPVRQGLWGIFEVFMDTIVICSLTALVILVSGVFSGPGSVSGAPLTIASYSTVFGNFGGLFVATGILFFAASTILSWSLYGQRCVEYLFGPKPIRIYQLLFILVVVLGSTLELTLVWDISDTLNGLMAIPNLIALAALSGVVFKLTRDYLKSR